MPAGLDGSSDPITTTQRTSVIDFALGAVIERRKQGRPMLVAIDGIDGSGKSTFADEIAEAGMRAGLSVVRSTVDSFHNQRRTRWKRGKSSPVGYYLDSHDLNALRCELLDPFKAGQGNQYTAAIFDEPSDQPDRAAPGTVGANDVLIFDGIFLQRPELARYWDFTIFLDGQERVDLRRLELILADLPPTAAETVSHVLEWVRWLERYSAGMRYYIDLVGPSQSADLVIDNNDLAAPQLRSAPVVPDRDD